MVIGAMRGSSNGVLLYAVWCNFCTFSTFSATHGDISFRCLPQRGCNMNGECNTLDIPTPSSSPCNHGLGTPEHAAHGVWMKECVGRQRRQAARCTLVNGARCAMRGRRLAATTGGKLRCAQNQNNSSSGHRSFTDFGQSVWLNANFCDMVSHRSSSLSYETSVAHDSHWGTDCVSNSFCHRTARHNPQH